MKHGIKRNVLKRINANRNTYAAAQLRDEQEAEAIKALNAREAAKKKEQAK